MAATLGGRAVAGWLVSAPPTLPGRGWSVSAGVQSAVVAVAFTTRMPQRWPMSRNRFRCPRVEWFCERRSRHQGAFSANSIAGRGRRAVGKGHSGCWRSGVGPTLSPAPPPWAGKAAVTVATDLACNSARPCAPQAAVAEGGAGTISAYAPLLASGGWPADGAVRNGSWWFHGTMRRYKPSNAASSSARTDWGRNDLVGTSGKPAFRGEGASMMHISST